MITDKFKRSERSERPERSAPARQHLAAVLLYAALAVALTWPLAIQLHDGLLGASVGDNATFVWNFWWIRKALSATVFLNGLCAYGAACALTRHPVAARVAGLAFAASPFLTVRLQGHFNVISAWGLPLLVMALVRYCRRPGVGAAVLVACALAALAYTDYYYAVFGGVLALLYVS